MEVKSSLVKGKTVVRYLTLWLTQLLMTDALFVMISCYPASAIAL